MDRLIYTTLSGLGARSRSQTVTANNLANAGTTGFRRELVHAEGRYLIGTTALSRVQSGSPATSAARDAGKVSATGNPLDVALGGDAWLAVQAADGSEAYTRRGDLRVAPTGVLETGDGRPVIGNSGVITVPAGATLEIAPDGKLSQRIGDAVTPLDALKLVDGASLIKRPDGLFGNATALPADLSATLTTGALENSNVETAGALVELVEQSRGFEIDTKMLGIARDLDERTTRLMAVEG